MNLYHISQDVNREYDTYSDAVVAAPDEDTAANMHPFDGRIIDWESESFGGTWQTRDWASKREQVMVELIGIAADHISQGVVCSSYLAG